MIFYFLLFLFISSSEQTERGGDDKFTRAVEEEGYDFLLTMRDDDSEESDDLDLELIAYEEKHYRLNVKKMTVLKSYINNWNQKVERNDKNEVTGFRKDYEIRGKVIIATLFGKWNATKLNLLLRVCSVHYAIQPDPGKPKRSKGCRRLADFMTWYNNYSRSQPEVHIADFPTSNEEKSEGASSREGKSRTFDWLNLTKTFFTLSQAMAEMNAIFTEVGANYYNVFKILQTTKPDQLDAEDAKPIRAQDEDEDEKNYYETISTRLWRFMGSEHVLQIENYFNEMFGDQHAKTLQDVIPSFDFYQATLKDNDFVDRAIVFDSNPTNYEVILDAERLFFLTLPNGSRMQIYPQDSDLHWTLEKKSTQYCDAIFRYQKPKNSDLYFTDLA